VRYEHAINSTALVNRLREEKSVLLVPGDHFGMDHYLRIGYGETPAYVTAGLQRVHDLLASLDASPTPRA
jgi:aspartate/methionine/tyrosine aminotransferase